MKSYRVGLEAATPTKSSQLTQPAFRTFRENRSNRHSRLRPSDTTPQPSPGAEAI
jgi:hypothetical protein